MKLKNLFSLLVLAIGLSSCGTDDDVVYTPPKNISEVIVDDEKLLQDFFATHFYNYEEFENPPENFDYKIVFDTISGDNSDKTSILNSESFGFKTVNVKSENVGAEGDESIDHKVYYIIAREGVGAQPTYADSTFVRYEGTPIEGISEEGDAFDSSTSPVWFNLTSSIIGFAHGITGLKAGGEIIENADGTYEVKDYGIGAIFLPSALGYYQGTTGIAAYTPLIFKLDLLAVNQADHDNDGIPSYLEDLNGNGRVNDDNTNAEDELLFNTAIPNYVDPDDDGDGVLTIDEIKIDGVIVYNPDGTIKFPDTNGNGIPDHLDIETR